jgi:hypothetical protein
MSLDLRLKQGFEHAVVRDASVDAALANVLASYHARRRNRAVLVAAAAAFAILVVTAGGGALRWVQGLEQGTPPAERQRDEPPPPSERDPEKAITKETRPLDLIEDLGVIGSRKPADSRRVGAVPPLQQDTLQPEQAPSAMEPDPAPAEPADSASMRRDLTRVAEEEWSHEPTGNSGVTGFDSRPNESFIRARLDISGGGGTSGAEAEVYEIVDGERSLIGTFCSYESYSPFFAITPGSRIEVHVSSRGCNGSDLSIKGTATVAFYSGGRG